MIGNRYLSKLFAYPDEDTGINQLLELLKSRDREFIDSLDRPVDLDLCTRKEVEWLTKVAPLLVGPDWLLDTSWIAIHHRAPPVLMLIPQRLVVRLFGLLDTRAGLVLPMIAGGQEILPRSSVQPKLELGA